MAIGLLSLYLVYICFNSYEFFLKIHNLCSHDQKSGKLYIIQFVVC